MDFDNKYLWIGVLVGIIILSLALSTREGFAAPFIPAQPWVAAPDDPMPYISDRLYLGGSTKCFSCEKDLISRGLSPYMGQPTKCVNCDAQAVHTYGPNAGNFGQNNKCFSCESQYANNPLVTHPRPRATPYCDARKCDSHRVSRFGRADGQSFADQMPDDGVGLVRGFGRADGLGNHEGDSQNPTGYQLSTF